MIFPKFYFLFKKMSYLDHPLSYVAASIFLAVSRMGDCMQRECKTLPTHTHAHARTYTHVHRCISGSTSVFICARVRVRVRMRPFASLQSSFHKVRVRHEAQEVTETEKRWCKCSVQKRPDNRSILWLVYRHDLAATDSVVKPKLVACECNKTPSILSAC